MENQIVEVKEQPQEMTDQKLTINQLVESVAFVHDVAKRVMKQGQHYGLIPGCGDKMSLFKPGAELLCTTFQMAPEYSVDQKDLGEGHQSYTVTANLYSRNTHKFLGAGVGSASTMESKHRYAKNVADKYNTVLKMAKKRALVDAVLTVTSASEIFTQDLEDMVQEREERPNPFVTMQQKPIEQAEPPQESTIRPLDDILSDPMTEPRKTANSMMRQGAEILVVVEKEYKPGKVRYALKDNMNTWYSTFDKQWYEMGMIAKTNKRLVNVEFLNKILKNGAPINEIVNIQWTQVGE